MNESPSFQQQNNLVSIFSSKQSMSLEINCNNGNNAVDFNALSTKLIDFVSVTWIGNFVGYFPKDIPPIKLAEQLVSRNINVLLHISCRNFDKESALNVLNHLRHIGVRNLLALEGESRFVKEKNVMKMDFPYTDHFVEFIKQNFANYFTIGVTGYPQKHPRSSDMKQQMEFLQLKVSKGADFIVTQGCLDRRVVSDFETLCKNFSISLPIVVGAFLLRSPDQLDIMRRCNIPVEDGLCKFRDSMVNKPQTFESYFRDRLRIMGEIVLDSTVSKFAGLHLFSSNSPEYIREIMDEFAYFAKKYRH